MTPNQAKKIAAQALMLQGFEFDKLIAKTVSFMDLARGSALFVNVKGLRDITPDSHLDRPTRFGIAKACSKAAGFILTA